MPDDRVALRPMGALRPRRPAPRVSERRDRVRCEVRIELDVEGENGPVACVTRDLSETGAFIVTDFDRPVGTTLVLRLQLPGSEEPAHCAAEVRWSRRGSTSALAPNGLGLRLLGLEPEVRRRVQALLFELAPLEADE